MSRLLNKSTFEHDHAFHSPTQTRGQ